MPAKSKAQARLMAAAEHGADFPMARKVRASMTHDQMHDFAATRRKALPAHVKTATPKRDHEAHAYNWRSRHNLKRGKA